MAVTEVTRENWFSRIWESIKGIFVGLFLFLAAFPLLFWNEGRAVKTARSLDEGAAAVVSIAADRVDGSLEGKLIHISGLATTTETLADPTFGVSLAAIKLPTWAAVPREGSIMGTRRRGSSPMSNTSESQLAATTSSAYF